MSTGPWLTYEEAADYCRLSKKRFYNLVCSGEVPVYGKPHRRRFRRDVLDLWLSDPAAAMRKFRLERKAMCAST